MLLWEWFEDAAKELCQRRTEAAGRRRWAAGSMTAYGETQLLNTVQEVHLSPEVTVA
jgi:hypothetical protein